MRNVAVTWVVPLVALGALAAPVGASSPSRSGPEFRVRTYTTAVAGEPSVSADPAGRFVVVWTSSRPAGGPSDLAARRFDPIGAPRGSEFVVTDDDPPGMVFEGRVA